MEEEAVALFLTFRKARSASIPSVPRYPHPLLYGEAKQPSTTAQPTCWFRNAQGSFLFRVTEAQLLSAVTTSLLNSATCHPNDV